MINLENQSNEHEQRHHHHRRHGKEMDSANAGLLPESWPAFPEMSFGTPVPKAVERTRPQCGAEQPRKAPSLAGLYQQQKVFLLSDLFECLQGITRGFAQRKAEWRTSPALSDLINGLVAFAIKHVDFKELDSIEELGNYVPKRLRRSNGHCANETNDSPGMIPAFELRPQTAEEANTLRADRLYEEERRTAAQEMTRLRTEHAQQVDAKIRQRIDLTAAEKMRIARHLAGADRDRIFSAFVHSPDQAILAALVETGTRSHEVAQVGLTDHQRNELRTFLDAREFPIPAPGPLHFAQASGRFLENWGA